jgi:hypothetical protein
MAPPTTIFKTFDRTIVAGDLNTADKRNGTPGLTGEATVSPTGAPLDLGIVDISGGQADSTVENMLWRVTASGGNTLVEDFGAWQLTGQHGFTIGTSDLKLQELMGDEGTPGSPQLKYVASAVVGSYADWATIPTTEGAEVVLHPTDTGTSMVVTTGADDAIFWAHYIAVAAGEDTGTYEDLVAGFEFQASFGYSYS